jgi:hypothetical protein
MAKAKRAPAGGATSERASVEVSRRARVTITIIGDKLLVNRPDQSLMGELPGGGGAAEAGTKRKKTTGPEATYLRARYMIDEKTHGFPFMAVKHAMVDGLRLTTTKKVLSMTEAKYSFHLVPSPKHEEYYPLRFKSVEHDIRLARNDSGKLVTTHRPLYREWEMDVEVEFNEHGKVTPQYLVNLLILGGEAGIGCLRPVQTGNRFGMFTVKDTKKKLRKGKAA